MKSVETLEKTTFSGRRFTRKQLEEIQDTVQLFQNLSRKELAKTLCEHLSWTAPNGTCKIHSCYALLEELEKREIITLPAKRQTKAPVRREVAREPFQPERPLEETLSAIGPIELQLVTTQEERNLWKAYLRQYHYLGYRQAFGAHPGYFIVSRGRGQHAGGMVKLGDDVFFSLRNDHLRPAKRRLLVWQQKHFPPRSALA